ncbi:putative ATP-dependent RNA helicase DDX46 [Saccoglossus kowalevskii]
MPRETRHYRKRSRSSSRSSSGSPSPGRSKKRRSRSRDREKKDRYRCRSRSRERYRRSRSRDRYERRRRSRSRERRELERERERERERRKFRRSRSRSRERKERERRRSKSRERDHRRSKSRERDHRRSKSKERDHRRSKSKERDHRRSKSKEHVHRRSKSRERDHKRSRSRDRENKRSETRPQERRRSRSKSKERRKSRSKSRERRQDRKSPSRIKEREHRAKTPTKNTETKIKKDKSGSPALELEQKRLEEEMQRRRERIEKWRLERKKASQPTQPEPQKKQWSLEDESDDDEGEQQEEEGKADKTEENGKDEDEKMETKKEEDDDVDPLDAFMQGVNDEVRQINMDDHKKRNKGSIAIPAQGSAYPPFRRDFYVEVPEIAKMTEEDVISYRAELENVKVRGKGCPKPIKAWVQCGVSKKVLDVLKKLKYEKPTPIQAQAIPAIMSGRNLIGIAKTGSGKTLAFLLPMFRHIMDQDPLEADDGPLAVIMSPTRELAMQIYKECKRFCRALNVRGVCVYGGTGISEQIAELKRGAEIIVCTPGRMIDMLTANSGRVTNLRRCTYVVLDEADRMFDMGFEPQVMRIVDNIRPDRQTVMFSATFPRQMEALARRILNKPLEVQVGGRSVVCSDVEQKVAIVDDDQKFLTLLELLGVYQEQGSVLVFVEKQEGADQLLKDLMKASYSCLSLHGGIDQYDRDSAIQDFKAGNIKLLIATSVAARGLDVKHLVLVVNYDCPNHYEDYVHRVGRTGRAGNKGNAFTFITPEQGRYAGDIIKAFEMADKKAPPELLQLWSEFTEKQKAEGKSIMKSSGFSGKGFKFDETEKELANEKKKLQKAALGLQDSDEEDAGVDIDQQIENMFASKKSVKDVTVPVGGNPALVPGAPIAGVAPTVGVNTEKLELAKMMAERINRNLEGSKDIMQQAAQTVMKGGMLAAPAVSAKTIADQMAEKINAKLNYRPSPENEDSNSNEPPTETFRRYEEELEINDFPQTARWKVTSKENLAQIQEYSEAGITIRGTYFPPGKEPKEGDRKLYLAIESTSEMAVQKSKKEITRLIKEELIRLQHSYQPTNKGRYKVL